MLERPELVIFDCDGVLVDTEPVTLRVMQAWLGELGLPLDYDTVAARFKGIYITDIQATIEAELGRDVPDFIDGYRKGMFAEFAKGIDPIAGAIDTLDALDAAGIPYCVGSNGPHSKMDASLRAAGMFERLRGPDTHSRIFSADDVGNPKPAPDLFVFAAGAMHTHPTRCVVIEDSVSGIDAARAAGMPCVGFADITPPETLRNAGPSAVITSMTDVASTLGLITQAS